MNDGIDSVNDVVLMIDDSARFVMSIDEALQIAMKLNMSTRIRSRWSNGANHQFVDKPDTVAHIVPITTFMRMEWESTRKEIEVKK